MLSIDVKPAGTDDHRDAGGDRFGQSGHVARGSVDELREASVARDADGATVNDDARACGQ
jgi:hypothetical protein